MKVGPSQRIMAYEAAKASRLSTTDAVRAAPSPWKERASTTAQAIESPPRCTTSVLVSRGAILGAADDMVALRDYRKRDARGLGLGACGGRRAIWRMAPCACARALCGSRHCAPLPRDGDRVFPWKRARLGIGEGSLGREGSGGGGRQGGEDEQGKTKAAGS